MRNKIVVVMVLMLSLGLFSTGAFGKTTDRISVLIGFRAADDYHLVTDFGGKITHKLKSEKIVLAEIPVNALAELRSNPNIEFVEEDGDWSATDQSVSWGIERVQADVAHQSEITGKGIKVGILDSGISPHEDLQVAGGWNFINNTADYSDDFGHGTMVAGIVGALDNSIGLMGVAPEAQLYSIKVLDQSGNAKWSTIAKGLDWAIANKMNIVNMSFGGPKCSKSIEKLLNRAYDSGILLVAASGNNAGTVNYPAKCPSVIAVGATDEADNIAFFSNTGPEIELVAPGFNISSTYKTNEYLTESGTSMAAPHVTGVAALFWSRNPDYSNVEIRKILTTEAIDLGPQGKDTIYGYGLVNFR